MPNVASSAGHAKVLVVEDDRLLRLMAVETLLDDGFTAIGVERAAEALDQLEASSDIALLVTDINMPGMSGLDLARLVRRRYPEVRLLLISGREQLDPEFSPQPFEFLQKPFSARSFLARIQCLLDR